MAEGLLAWPALGNQIMEKFGDRIGPEPKSPNKSRILNLVGMTMVKTTERVRLPMYGPIEAELEAFSHNIKHPVVKAKSKRDTKPLVRGFFPISQRNLLVQPLSGRLNFNHPAQLEMEVDWLLPAGHLPKHPGETF